MKRWETVTAIERDPTKVSGAWVFRGTRVPVAALFENLRDGATIEEFLEWFPGVTRTQVEASILIGFEDPEGWSEEARLRDPRFKEGIEQALTSLGEGKGISIEWLRKKYGQ